ncbi:class I SAM-dependent methyltransferase, partial [Mycobacterium tuberculosis]
MVKRSRATRLSPSIWSGWESPQCRSIRARLLLP